MASLLFGLALSPYMVAKVGLSAFGFWSVIQAILAYAQIGNGGMPVVATRIVASSFEANDRRRLFQGFWTALLSMTALGAAVIAVTVMVVALLPPDFGSELPADWRPVSIGAAVAFAALMVSRAASAITQGLHRWDIDAGILTTAQAGWALAIVVTLEAGFGLEGIAIASITPGVIATVAYFVAAHRLLGKIDRPERPSAGVVREFKSQFVNLQIVMFVGATNAQADRFLLLPFAPLSWIGAYALGSRMATALRGLPLAAFYPVFARGSARFESGGIASVGQLYAATFPAVVGVGTAGLLGIYGALYPGVLAWLGSDFTISATAAVVLGTGYAINIATGPGTALALSCGRSDIDRDYNILGLILNVLLTFPLAIVFGPWGVVAATFIGLTSSSVWLLTRADRLFATSWPRLLTTPPMQAPRVVAACIILGLSVATTVTVDSTSRIVNLAIAGVFAAMTAALVARPALALIAKPKRDPAAATASTTTLKSTADAN